MKILQFVHDYGAEGAGYGMESYTGGLMAKLEERGHQNVVVYETPLPPVPQTPGRASYQLPDGSANGGSRSAVERLREIICTEHPDAAFVHTVGPPDCVRQVVESLPSLFFAHTPIGFCPSGGKFFQRDESVCNVRWGPICLLNAYVQRCTTRRPALLWQFYRRTQQMQPWLRQAPYIVVPSTYMRDQFIAEELPSERIVMLPDPVPIPEHAVPSPIGDPTVFAAARLEPSKGVRYLVAAMALLPQEYSLAVAGDGAQRAKLEALALRLGVASRTTFLGRLEQAEVSAWYQRAHVVVVPSVWPEPFGLVGPEAMAHGRPVVAFNVGGIPDWLTDGETGFLVDAKDVKGLAARIRMLGEDPALAKQFGARGREIAKERFTFDGHIDRLAGMLEALMGLKTTSFAG